MVDALCRRPPSVVVENEGKTECMVANELPLLNNKFPCALREFINSNANLPTIDELVKKSRQLAMAIGRLD